MSTARIAWGPPRLALLEERHEAVASHLVDISAGSLDAIEKSGEIALHHRAELIRGHPLAEAGVAADVEHEHGDVLLDLLGQLERIGIDTGEPLDGFGDESGELVANAALLSQLLLHGALELEGCLNARHELARVMRLGEEVVGPGFDPLNAILHLVEGGHDQHGDKASIVVLL